MIDIDFHDQSALIHKLGENLVGQHPSCWDVVLPPGFGEERFARQLAEFLGHHPHRPLVAVQGADHSNPTISEFIRALHWQWEETKRPPKALDRSASIYLDMLLESLRTRDRTIILVLKRFHKVLENLSKWVLGKLRQEEQNKRLHTVVISPLPLTTLKKRWESRRDHYFSTSDYGDSRHMQVTVSPPLPEEVDRLCESLDIVPAVAVYARQITGSYPEHLSGLLEWWLNNHRPPLTPTVRKEMLEFGSRQLGVFLEWLDPVEDGHYRDCVIDLYHGENTDQALEAFQQHPWREVVLEEQGLRAEALGARALAALQANTDRRTVRSPWYDEFDRSRRLYHRRQYEATLHVLESIDASRLRPQDRILQAHARIMLELSGADGGEYFGGDTNCRRLRQALQRGQEALATVKLPLSAIDRIKIDGRYGQLDDVAAAIYTAGTVTGQLQNRLVDILAGFTGQLHQNARGAALLLLLKAEAGKAIAGDGSACQFVLSLPEQIFRTWAFWALNLNYYHAPPTCNKTWDIVEKEWPQVHGVVQRATPGMEFPNFYVFAFYALSSAKSLSSERQVFPPEIGFSELLSALSSYEGIRTGNAHAVYQPSKRQRQAYFHLIDRWLTSLMAVCPDAVSREELLELTEPLPIVNADGTVSW